MFSTLRGVCPARFQIKRAFVICLVPPSRSIQKLPPRGFVFKFCNTVPVKIRIQNREFHTTKRLDIPPLFALILRPVLRVGSFIFGRTIRRWWQKKTPSERAQYAAWLQKKKKYIYGTIGSFFFILLVYYLAHIERTVVTNRPRFIMFTKQQEAAFAKLMFDAHVEEHKDHILPKNHPIYKQLLKITNRILNANKDLPYVKDKQWTLSVIDSPAKNAYVLPGGNIFIFTGALQMVENDDQLSFIIAHEMAHALLKHSIEQVSNGFLVDLLLVLPIVIVWAIFPDLIAGLLQFLGTWFVNILHDLPYSRALETEADEVGLTLAAKACVDVREAVVFWGMMRALKDMNAEPEQIPWLSTHPDHEDREKNLDSQMAQAIALRSTSQCPTLNPTDPRKRFYEKSQKELATRFRDRGVL